MLGNRDVAYLKEKAKAIRLGILDAIGVDNKGHVGGSMSAADIVAALYFYKMNHSPDRINDSDRDRFIFSKGHSALTQYAALAECGYFSKSELPKTKTLGAMLQGHPERDYTPGVECNTGSLGQGLSIGLGMALGGKLDGRDYKVYVILGDGELGEGQVWEAATAASFYKADNLVAIIDHNQLMATGPIKECFDVGNIGAKFAAFGWKVFEIDGHDMEEIVDVLDEADEVKGLPCAIVARTVKGKGVYCAENVPGFHNGALNAEQFERARSEIANM